MDKIGVVPFAIPESPHGTIVWAAGKVLRLLDEDGDIRDAVLRDMLVSKLLSFCEGNFKNFMPDAVKREYGKTFGVHLRQYRLVGFFDRGYADFIALDFFMKKTQHNDRRMTAIYEKVDAIREAGTWTRMK
ncbi:MAG: hypothetical protein LBT97_12125 [Planctomycetota bacterium]|jgi:hypothetical protein|nr:hypothetical protein [Planctomycetota bacterium]